MTRKSIFAPLIAASLALSVGCAHADASDDAFLQAMRDRGLAQFFSSPANEISEAHRVCTDLREDGSNASANAIAFVIGRDHHINSKALEDSFVGTSIDFYCPDVPHPQF